MEIVTQQVFGGGGFIIACVTQPPSAVIKGTLQPAIYGLKRVPAKRDNTQPRSAVLHLGIPHTLGRRAGGVFSD